MANVNRNRKSYFILFVFFIVVFLLGKRVFAAKTVSYNNISDRLLAQTETPPITPLLSPTTTPALISCPVEKPAKQMGNANCDSLIDNLDLNIWKSEFFNQPTVKNADFNNDGKVDGIDFEYWRRNRWLSVLINRFAQEEGTPSGSIIIDLYQPLTFPDLCFGCGQ